MQYGVSVMKFYDEADCYNSFKKSYNSFYYNSWSEESNAKEF